MQVGELAARTGASVRAIRYYERAGLVPAVRRANGYRDFDASAIERVATIRDLLASGFTLDDITSLGSCLEGGRPDARDCCTRTVSVYRAKLERVDRQLQTLATLRDRIEARIEELEPC